MTELITDHAYERGPYGRCAAGSPPCNKRKSSHDNEPVPGPVVSPLRLESSLPPQTTSIEASVVEPFPPPTSFPPEPPSKARATVVQFKTGLGGKIEEIELDWPPNWPHPLAGQIIRVGKIVARVREVEFDLDRKRLILACQ